MSELKVIDLGDIRESIEKDESVYYEYYAKSEADAVIAEKDKEIAELKDKCQMHNRKLCAELCELSMRERRLRRALWLARAQRANEHYHRYHGKFVCPLEDIPEYVKWKQVERKCRAKAEEYR